MKIYLYAFLALMLIASCASAAPKTGGALYTEIRATVLSADKLAFPNTRLSLRVTSSSDPKILDLRNGPRTITAENRLLSVRGKVDCRNSQNINSISAYYLLQGDEIRGKLYIGATRGTGWYIYGISRIVSGSSGQTTRSVKMYDDLELALSTDRKEYNPGDPVDLTFTVTNKGSEKKTLRFVSGKQYDFTVSQSGREIWHWSAGKVFIMVLTSKELSPGQSLKYSAIWHQGDDRGQEVAPGTYDIKAELTTTGTHPTVGSVSIVIKQ